MKNRILFATISAMLIIGGLAFAQDTTLTITNDGNVGIGTTNPEGKLHVEGDVFLGKANESTRYIRMPRTAGGNNGNLELQAGGVTGFSGAAFQGGNIVLRAGDLNTAGGAWVGSGSVFIYAGKNWFGNFDNGNIHMHAGNDNEERLTILGDNGRVGIGTTQPDQLLSVNGNASKVGGGFWATFSDVRMKKDINPFNDGLSVLKQINPVTFQYNGKLGYPTDKTYVGVIAQDIKQIAPYTISTFRTKLNPEDKEESDVLQFDGSALIYMAINAIQELDEKIEELNQLKNENQVISQRLNELESIVKTLAEQKNNSAGELMTELH